MPIFNQTVKGGGTTPTGSISITNNGTYDVTDKATAVVNVPVNAIPDYYVKKTIDGNGKLVFDSSQTTMSTSPATDVASSVFTNAFNNAIFNLVDCSSLTSVSGMFAFNYAFSGATIGSFDFSNIRTISGNYAFASAFAPLSGSNITISFNSLEVVSGAFAFDNAFSGGVITSVLMPNLTDIGNTALANAFCGSAISVMSFPALETVGDSGLQGAFAWQEHITTLTLGGTTAITFGAFALSSMFDGCSQNIDVYAPAANKSEIEAMTDYPNFGGTGTVTWHWRS